MSITVGGIMSGLDTNNIIDQLVELERRPIVQLQEKEAEYQVELSAYGTLRSHLNELKSAMENLDDEGDLDRFSATPGDSDLLAASADETAVTGTYNVTVSQLARVQKLKSGAFTETEAVGKGTLHLQVGDGDARDISIGANDTIEDVADAINEENAGVKASVIFDGADYYLTLTAEDSGADNVIDLTMTEDGTDPADPENTDNTGLSRLYYEGGNVGGDAQGGTGNLEMTQSSRNAVITVDGVTGIERDTNTIDDVITGVTLDLQDEGDTTVTVSRDTSSFASSIESFVETYNGLLDFFEERQSFDRDTLTAGDLFGDSTTNQIRNRLENLMSASVPGLNANYDTLVDLGVTMNDEGRMEVNSTKLNSILGSHFDDVAAFFTQDTDGSEGFGVRMVEALDGFLDSDGVLTTRTDGIQRRIDDIDEDIEAKGVRLISYEERLRAEFTSLELLISEFQSTGQYLEQQISGLQNMSKK